MLLIEHPALTHQRSEMPLPADCVCFHKGVSSIPTLCQTSLMKNLTVTVTICLAVALLFGSLGASWSQDFQKGLAAYDSGDYATALREWTPLAEQGHAGAQNNLGLMYYNGEGVPQDDKTAVKWYRLAA